MAKQARGAARKTAPALQPAGGPPAAPRGPVRSGRIVTLLLGQGHGFVRLADGRKVFFHKSDLREGTRFGSLEVGETLAFELFEDPVSGPRALQAERRTRRR